MIIVDKSLIVDDSKLTVVAPQRERDANVEATSSKFDALLKSETDKLNRYKEDGDKYSLKKIFKEASERYGISQDLLEAIGYHESRFQTNATSYAGAMGIMQLMPGTATAMGVTDAYDPYQNIMGAAKLLGYLNRLYKGDTKLVLAGYAAGTGSVAKYGGVPPFKETQQFIADIYELLDSKVFIDSAGRTVSTTTPVASASSTVPTTTPVASEEAKPATTDSKENAKQLELANAIISATTRRGISSSSDNFSSSLSAAALNSLLGSGSNASSSLSGLSVSSLLSEEAISNNLQDYFSYSDYELMMNYYNNMLSIISSIGTDDTSLADDDNSLSDLFSLGMKQRFGTDNILSTNQINTQTMSDVAAKYLANSNML